MIEVTGWEFPSEGDIIDSIDAVLSFVTLGSFSLLAARSSLT